jgi:hypothetical protein
MCLSNSTCTAYNAAYLSQLCRVQVPMVTMTCELGMARHSDHLPNPAAFPACCLVVSEMDSAVGLFTS